jgi:hypothetical protein
VSFAQAAVEFLTVRAGEMENLEHFDIICQYFRLTYVPGDAVENEEIDVGFEKVGVFAVGDVSPPELDREIIWYQLALAGIVDKLLAQRSAGIEGSENVAAGKMVKPGNPAQNGPLGALAASGGSENEKGAVFLFRKVGHVGKGGDE